jgi:threonine/homoserine/homoserine lactone efflux protein
MILAVIGVGVLSALTPGPSTFNLMRLRLHYGRTPWQELGALILGDLCFFGIALGLLHTSLLQELWLQKTLQVITAVALLWFAIKGLFGLTKNLRGSAEQNLITGPGKVFALTVSNPNVLLIYLSLVGLLPQENRSETLLVMSGYLGVFLLSFMVFLWAISKAKDFIHRIERPLELLVCSGFLIYSLRIAVGVL